MKISDIQAGHFYYDGKKGIRLVLSIDQERKTLKYQLICAKQTKEYNRQTQQMQDMINKVVDMNLQSFAAWAKSGHDQQSIDAVLLSLKAQAIKLSPGELEFMREAIQEVGRPVQSGLLLGIDHTEMRAAKGLVKKGIVIVMGEEAQFTALGQAWTELNRETAVHS